MQGGAGVEAAGEGDADLLADGKMFEDVGHGDVSILSGDGKVGGDSRKSGVSGVSGVSGDWFPTLNAKRAFRMGHPARMGPNVLLN